MNGDSMDKAQQIVEALGQAGFAAQVCRLLDGPELRRRLAANGRRLVEAKYGWEEIGRRFVELIESVSAERGRATC